MTISRRKMMTMATVAATGLPLLGTAIQKESKTKVLVAGGHPDDPETGCGGTMSLYRQIGHEVTALYLTGGEAGIPGTSHEDASRIRKKETEKACSILGAKPIFAGQIDGDTKVDVFWYKMILEIVRSQAPDIVFTHWPVDTHRDHRAISLLIYDAWIQMGRSFELFYFEVMSGAQTQHFPATHYVDISAVETIKREACYAHASQNPDEFYPYHEKMSKFRGMESGNVHAEAFVRQVRNKTSLS
ncbi:MAG: PIG-L family deacetylase [Cyclobacteriaceae bacterium]|nr:PIG-L family deacetylase [Cyclobacteriaceae bacterium]